MPNQPPDPLDYKLTIGGIVVPVMSGRFVQELNSLGDCWTAEIDWVPGRDKSLDAVLAPFSYAESELSLGGKKVATGRLYTVTNKVTAAGGATKVLICYTASVDLVDSTFRPSAEPNYYEKASLSTICNELLKPRGFGFRINGPDNTFQAQYVSADPTETIASFLIRLAAQHGYLMANDSNGAIVFTRSNQSAPSVGTIFAGDRYATDWEATFDGRKRFAEYWGIGQSGDGDNVFTKAMDGNPNMPADRVQAFELEDASTGEMSPAVNWRRSKQLSETLSIAYPVHGWYAPNGSLWAANTLVTIQAPSLHVASGFDFLIRKAEFIFEAGGCITQLTLVPPQVYTGAQIVDPWSQRSAPKGKQAVVL